MRKLIALFITILMMVCCASGRYIPLSDPQAAFDAEQILYDAHPELVPYYEAGVLRITSMREVVDNQGNVSYKLKYKFVKRYFDDYTERMACLKEYYPELYQMYVNGIVKIYSLYRYVDNNGQIRHHVSYHRLYDYYYEYVPLIHPYGGYRYYYRPRVLPPPRHYRPPVINRPPQHRPPQGNRPPRGGNGHQQGQNRGRR